MNYYDNITKDEALKMVCKYDFYFLAKSEKWSNDKDIMLEAVKKDFYSFDYASESLKKDESFLLQVAETCKENIFKFPLKAMQDKNFVLKLLGINVNYYNCLNSLKFDREITLSAVKNGLGLNCVAEEFKNDKEVVLVGLKNNIDRYGLECSLKYASESLKDDKDVVLQAIQIDSNSLKYASERLRDDKQIVLIALSKTASCFDYISNKLKQDEEVVLKAVEYGLPVNCVPKKFLDNRNIVLKAVNNGSVGFNSTPLDGIKFEFLDDAEIVFRAVLNDGKAIKNASDRLKNDKELVLVALRQNGNALEFVSENLKSDKDCILTACSSRLDAIKFANPLVLQDFYFIKELLTRDKQRDSKIFAYFPYNLRNDKDFIKKVIKDNYLICEFLTKELLFDKNFILELAIIDERILDVIPLTCINFFEAKVFLLLENLQNYQENTNDFFDYDIRYREQNLTSQFLGDMLRFLLCLPKSNQKASVDLAVDRIKFFIDNFDTLKVKDKKEDLIFVLKIVKKEIISSHYSTLVRNKIEFLKTDLEK